MSRGPGRMMRAALAELDTDTWTSALCVALRARHDEDCDCGDVTRCIVTAGRGRRLWADQYQLERADLVAARRALHTLAARGQCGTVYVAGDGGGRVMYAYRSHDGTEATLRFPPRPAGTLPTPAQFVRAVNAMHKRCHHPALKSATE